MTYRFLALVALTGCNSFTTIDEACLDEVPGQSFITDGEDVEIAARVNCYRRVANTPKAPIDEAVQQAVEAHRDYLELNTPQLNLRVENGLLEGFTGANASDRLQATGYTFQPNTSLLEITTAFYGDLAMQFTGAEHLEFWFADPFLRPAFLQPQIADFGLATAEYVIPAPPDTESPEVPISLAYYNVVYRYLSPAVAEAAKAYPRNGQVDAPGNYLHLGQNDALEFGRTYGYPITFTVGSRETGLVVDQFNLRGPNGSVPAQVLTGADAAGSVGLTNTAILVPDDPLVSGGEYTAFIQIITDQGIRRARTTFTVGTNNRPLPVGLGLRELPVISARSVELAPSEP